MKPVWLSRETSIECKDGDPGTLAQAGAPASGVSVLGWAAPGHMVELDGDGWVTFLTPVSLQL